MDTMIDSRVADPARLAVYNSGLVLFHLPATQIWRLSLALYSSGVAVGLLTKRHLL